jgi:hypothetical protein
MEFYLLVDVEFLPEFDEDAVDGIEVVAVVSASGGEVQDYQVVVLAVSLQRLVVFVPFHEEGLLADSSIGLDYQRLVLLSGGLHVQPLLDHEVVLLQTASRLVFIEAKHDVRRAILEGLYSM